ncbi:hypothetical protein T484DRAFT_3409716 [Baffinella frigidus]|nr:hypothetical protein T484DRAFT_3409716 [Cryptophyta sp. CCMP2293]
MGGWGTAAARNHGERARSQSVNAMATDDSSHDSGNTSQVLSQASDSTVGVEQDYSTPALSCAQTRNLIGEEHWSELAAYLCNLRAIRYALQEFDGVMKLLRIFNEACLALESALTATRGVAVDARDTGEKKEQLLKPECVHIGVALDRVRQHRRFLLQHSATLKVRPQAVLQTALIVNSELPAVARNAADMVRFGETTVKKLSMGFRDVKEKPCHSISACVSLAVLKAALRDVWLDGTMESTLCSKGVAAQFRVLTARVGLRLLETREVIEDRGIAVEAHVLTELVRTDDGQFPSSDQADRRLAKEAIDVAQRALLELDLELQQQRVERKTKERRDKEVEMASKREDMEMKSIAETERKREFLRRADRTRADKIMKQALREPCWQYTMPPGSAARDGGCICMDGSRVFASSDSPIIKVLDLDSVMFAFCKEYSLEGHTKRVLSLCVGVGNFLFSGALDSHVRVWDLDSMACIQTIKDHEHAVTGVAIADDATGAQGDSKGKYLCSSSYDTTIRVFKAVPRDTVTSAARGEVQEHRKSPANSHKSDRGSPGPSPFEGVGDRGESASPTGSAKKAISSSPFAPATATLWVPLRVLRGSAVYVHAIATRGHEIFSTGEDGLIKQWSVLSKHSVGQLEGCADMAYALCIREPRDDPTDDVASSPVNQIKSYPGKQLGAAGATFQKRSQQVATTSRLFQKKPAMDAQDAQIKQISSGQAPGVAKLAGPLLFSAGTDFRIRGYTPET